MKCLAVIFDLFGTLVNNFTRSEYEGMLAEMAAALNVPVEKFKKQWSASFIDRVTGLHNDQRDSFRSICRKLGINVSSEQIEKAFRVRLDFSRRTTVPRQGCLEVLARLRKDGYKIGLISDCTGEIPLVWSETLFHGLFDVTVFSCVVKIKKPDPRIYRLAYEALKVRPEHCLYVGDGSGGELTGALKAGMRPVLIRDPHDSVDAGSLEREDDWAGLKISSLEEVLELVK